MKGSQQLSTTYVLSSFIIFIQRLHPVEFAAQTCPTASALLAAHDVPLGAVDTVEELTDILLLYLAGLLDVRHRGTCVERYVMSLLLLFLLVNIIILILIILTTLSTIIIIIIISRYRRPRGSFR